MSWRGAVQTGLSGAACFLMEGGGVGDEPLGSLSRTTEDEPFGAAFRGYIILIVPKDKSSIR